MINSITTFIKGTMRTTSYPSTEQDWMEMLGTPVALGLPAEFGLALAPYEQRGERSPMGRLIDAYRFDGDLEAGRVLSEILERWLVHHRLHDHFDLMSTIPAPYTSGPAYNIHSLLCWPGRDYLLMVYAPLWSRPTAESGHSTISAGSEWGSIQSSERETAVARRRILLVFMCLTSHDDLSIGLHELYAQGAAKVGVVAMCHQLEIPRGG